MSITLVQLVYSIILGAVQGISEWLPISSKTQVMVASTYLLNLNYQEAYTFGLFLEIGTVLAAVIYFRRELGSLLRALIGKGTHEERKLLKYVVVVTIITGIIGAPLYLVADSITGISVGIPMLIVGLVLIADALVIKYSHTRREQKVNKRKFDSLRLKDYIIIGIAQGIAALPGVSRSGITTSAMLIMDIEPDEAFRLSFLIGIFAALAAFALTLIVSRHNVAAALAGIGIEGLFAAIITATLVSLFLIDFLIKVAGKSRIVYLTGGLGILAIAAGCLYIIFGI